MYIFSTQYMRCAHWHYRGEKIISGGYFNARRRYVCVVCKTMRCCTDKTKVQHFFYVGLCIWCVCMHNIARQPTLNDVCERPAVPHCVFQTPHNNLNQPVATWSTAAQPHNVVGSSCLRPMRTKVHCSRLCLNPTFNIISSLRYRLRLQLKSKHPLSHPTRLSRMLHEDCQHCNSAHIRLFCAKITRHRDFVWPACNATWFAVSPVSTYPTKSLLATIAEGQAERRSSPHKSIQCDSEYVQ